LFILSQKNVTLIICHETDNYAELKDRQEWWVSSLLAVQIHISIFYIFYLIKTIFWDF